MTQRIAEAEGNSGTLLAVRAVLATMALFLVLAFDLQLGEVDPYALLVACLKALFAF